MDGGSDIQEQLNKAERFLAEIQENEEVDRVLFLTILRSKKILRQSRTSSRPRQCWARSGQTRSKPNLPDQQV